MIGNILSIDPSLSGFAMVVHDRHGNITEKEISTKFVESVQGRMHRISLIMDELYKITNHNMLDMVLIEGYSYGSKGRGTLNLAELGGILRYTLYTLNYLMVEVPPTTIKKFICGKGNANKIEVSSTLAKRYGRMFDTDNLSDAFGLAKLGAVVLGWESMQYSYQEDAVKIVKDLIQQEKQNVRHSIRKNSKKGD